MLAEKLDRPRLADQYEDKLSKYEFVESNIFIIEEQSYIWEK